jgi:hypothetical protein
MEHLRNLVGLFSEKHPGLKAKEAHFEHIETVLLPHLLRVVQRDNTLFDEIELFPGIKVEWVGNDENWKKLHMAMVYSVLHGDPKEKFGKIFEAVKTFMPGNSAQADEFQKIFEKDDTKDAMSEIFELIMKTRLVSLVGDVMGAISFDGMDLEDPEKLMEMLRNPQASPVLQALMERAKTVLEEKVKSGKINPNELRRDIETIRAKVQSSFGKYLNEAFLGEQAGNTTGNTAQEILSNHPDARRARMLARLQKKQQQKSGSKK